MRLTEYPVKVLRMINKITNAKWDIKTNVHLENKIKANYQFLKTDKYIIVNSRK